MDNLKHPSRILPIKQVLFTQKRSCETVSYEKNRWRILQNYILRFGLKYSFLKIQSRLHEAREDQYNLCCAVVDYNGIDSFGISINYRLGEKEAQFRDDMLFEFKNNTDLVVDKLPNELIDWSPCSEVPFNLALLQKHVPFLGSRIDIDTTCITEGERELIKVKKGGTAIVGFGNYSRTIIMPNIRKKLSIDYLCDIKQFRISPFELKMNTTIWFKDILRAIEKKHINSVFIATYHHYHTPYAIEVIKRGAIAVIEKPLSTTRKDFHSLKEAIEDYNGRFYSCFQKRYNPFNKFIHKDLGVTFGDPINMCASVFEISLPNNHWYNWKVSGSNLVSNGCHWLDYFLYLNDYCDYNHYNVSFSDDQFVLIYVKLVNGAVLNLCITHEGSHRLGVRENIELRSNNATIHIVDAHKYVSENTSGKIRKFKCHPLAGHENMYYSISQKIKEEKQGDSIKSLLSTKLMLDLEEKLLSRSHRFSESSIGS